MQNMLYLRDTDDGPIKRIINISHLATACRHKDNPEWTQIICGFADITMHFPLESFIKQLEHLISENYRIALQDNMQWHQKKIQDTENIMRSALKDAHNQ